MHSCEYDEYGSGTSNNTASATNPQWGAYQECWAGAASPVAAQDPWPQVASYLWGEKSEQNEQKTSSATNMPWCTRQEEWAVSASPVTPLPEREEYTYDSYEYENDQYDAHGSQHTCFHLPAPAEGHDDD